MTRLGRLLRPRSIAVVGGGAFGAAAVEQSLKMGFTGDLWPVHPSKETVAGLKTYPSVATLPGGPDAAFVCVNRRLTVEVMRQLRARGAGGVICFAAGFRETEADDPDGARLQQELVEAAGEVPMIGPNCYGLINYADGALLWPDQHGGRRLAKDERGAAIITQSSNIAMNLTMQQRGLPVAFIATAGNQAQIGLSEMALDFLEDERVSVLGLHIEGFDAVAGFETLAARAHALAKPIVAIKVGRSEQARATTVSHTASLAGSDAASGAFLRRLGIARVATLPAFLEALKLLHGGGPLAGGRLSSLSCSGGDATLMADSAVGRAVYFPPIGASHVVRIREALGPLVAIANPLDYNTFIWGNEQALTAAMTAMTAGDYDLNFLVLDFPRVDLCSDAAWWLSAGAFAAALKANNARGAIVSTLGENLSESAARELFRLGIAPIQGIAEAMDAAEAALAIGTAWANAAPQPVVGPAGNPTAANETLSEAAAKSWLSESGLPVPEGSECADVETAVARATQLGFPVALKALGVAHKSEAGAVVLNIANEHELRVAVHRLSGLGFGLYLERMVQGGVAELIVGVTRDPLFGPVMTLGSGGVLVELLKDTITLLLPASHADIEAALRGLKLFPLLDGYRGREKADLEAAIQAIKDIADFALAHADRIAEMDINPLIVRGEAKGAWIADALIIVAEGGPR
jgi:acetate---CoA ligase (ADP-forming)